jgi:hypothetical protein
MPLSTAAIASFALAFAFLAFNMWAMVHLGLPRPSPQSDQALAMRRVRAASGGAFVGAAILIWALALTVTPGLLSPL